MLLRPWWPAIGVWALAWGLMVVLDEQVDLANMALILVLGAALAAVWAPTWAAMAMTALAVLAFDVAFVPPRGSFTVELDQHLLLLATMLAISWIVALLVARLRWHATQATAHALRLDQLLQLSQALRATKAPAEQAAALQDVLSRLGAGHTALLLPGRPDDHPVQDDRTHLIGQVSPDEATGLRVCLRDGRAMGPGTGRHEDEPAWYLPLRGLRSTPAAALVRMATHGHMPEGMLTHMQALCDQVGAALERDAALGMAARAREHASEQALRNTLLTAISHDHRTPLATILGAATALHDQGERLSPPQRQRLAATIVDEAAQLSRLTDNTLQLARLGSVGQSLRRDWESVEELVGSVLRRVRQRKPNQQLKVRVEPGLELLRCDAVLMVQMLDNLVDNALKHGSAEGAVEVVARRVGDGILIAVRDRGPGVPPALRERIFETFERGERANPSGAEGSRPGAGVGLALCRAIARAHGGELRLRPRGHGGSSFELHLPVEAVPKDIARGNQKGTQP